MKREVKVISKYTTEEAVEDGILVHTGYVNTIPIYFTTNLFEWYEDKVVREGLVNRGLQLLSIPDKEDTHWKLRVIEKNKIWIIWNSEGITFMKPEDY